MQKSTDWILPCLGLVLGMSACGGGGSSLGDSPTLSGTIQAWSLGSGYSLQAELTTGAQQQVLSSGSIDPQGTFSITLPGAEVMNQYTQYQSTVATSETGCGGTVDGTVTVSPDPMLGIKVTFYAVQGTTRKRVSQTGFNIMATTQTSTQSSTQVSYYFMSVPGSASGQISCVTPTTTVRASLNLGLVPGWNSVVRESFAEKLSTGTTSGSTSLYSGTAPAQAPWSLN